MESIHKPYGKYVSFFRGVRLTKILKGASGAFFRGKKAAFKHCFNPTSAMRHDSVTGVSELSAKRLTRCSEMLDQFVDVTTTFVEHRTDFFAFQT
jgi:hypothetical protein